MGPRVRFLTTPDGLRIAYAESGSGPPLVFVRGWISHLESLWGDPLFRRFIEALHARHLVIRYDARGNGLSDRPSRAPTLNDLVLDLEAVVEHLGLKRAILYATAFGGPIAVAYAVRHPEHVDRMVLSGTFARGSAITSPMRQRVTTLALRYFPEMAFLLLGHVTQPEGQPSGYRRPELVHKMIAPDVAAQLYKLAFGLDLRDMLKQVVTPTLVLHRRDSQSIPLHQGREVASLIPGAKLVVLDGAPHNDWEGDTSEVIDAVSAFLAVPLHLASSGAPEPPWSSQAADGEPRYVPERTICAGPHSIVHAALDRRLGRKVAVKVLPQSLGEDPTALARFGTEARAIARLNHPHICTIHDIDQLDGCPCIVMELLEGHSLRDLLQEGPVAPDRIVVWSTGVSDGLAAAHAHGIIHRDIKPSNIFITDRNQAKILDFGIAKLVRTDTLTGGGLPVTRSGFTVGTIQYMSPEQVEGADLDPRSDLFSLGVVMYEMATGRHPFTASTTAVTLARILTFDPPRVTVLAPEVPADLADVIQRCLEKDVARRYAGATALLAALAACARQG